MEVIERLEGDQGMRCKNCLYFDPPECKRYPPRAETKLDGYGEKYVETTYPIVDLESWCGEFKEVENGQAEKYKRGRRKVSPVTGGEADT